MTISTVEYNRCVVVKMVGRVDFYTAPNLEQILIGFLDKGRYNIVFDMAEVDFLSSKGLRVLTQTQSAARKHGGKLVLAHIDKRIEDSLKLVGLYGFFDTYDDLTAAVGSF